MPDQPAAPSIDARGILTELLDVTARIDALTVRKTELRTILEAEAFRRYEDEGAVPSWKVPRLGTATLAAADAAPDVAVTDADLFAAWLVDVYPTEVELAVTIAGTTLKDNPAVDLGGNQSLPLADVLEVLANLPAVGSHMTPRTKILDVIAANGLADAETGHLVDESGSIVDGVAVTAKRPYLSVRLNAEAKARARAALDVLDLPAPAAAADADEDEGAGDAPPPDEPAEGPERTSTITVGEPARTDDPVELARRLEASAEADR